MFAYQFSRYRHRAEALGCTPFAMMQPQYNLLYREEEREMLPLCTEEGVGILPWSPLAGGALCRNRQANTVRSQSSFGGNHYRSEVLRLGKGCYSSCSFRWSPYT